MMKMPIGTSVYRVDYGTEGLTKREYFAALAMMGYCSTPRDVSYDRIAQWAVHQADALIEALNNTEGKLQ